MASEPPENAKSRRNAWWNILIEAYNKFRTEKCVRLQKSFPRRLSYGDS